MIEVADLSDDKLSRTVWKFCPYHGKLVLHQFAHEGRKSTRHKWKAVGGKWDHTDERSYYSSLERPQDIPQDVMERAVAKFRSEKIEIYIGWLNDESLYRTGL